MTRRLLVAAPAALLMLLLFVVPAALATSTTYVVNSAETEVSGCTTAQCNLTQAIIAVNQNPTCHTAGACEIAFNLPRSVLVVNGQIFLGGPQVIHVPSTLPVITQPVFIDGTTQPGFGFASLVAIQGPGGNTPPDGLTLKGGQSIVRGLVINGFGTGVRLQSNDNKLFGNFIGTDSSGSTSLGNSLGIAVQSGGNTIGGPSTDFQNVISGNGTGIAMLRSDNVVQGNKIGTDASGTKAVPNDTVGVLFNSLDGGSNNLVGGTGFGEGNVIAFNGAQGIQFNNPACCGFPPPHGNALRGNSIFSNRGLGIDESLASGTVQPPPVLTGAGAGFSSVGLRIVPTTTISGAVSGTPNTTLSLDFFDNDACDPSGFGEGQSYVGSRPVTTDASGNASFQATFQTTLSLATATATSATNETSSFSHCRFVPSAFTSGTPHLNPADATITDHQPITFTYKWTVPAPRTWHDLTSLQLRFRNDQHTILQLKWEAASNTFSVYNPASRTFGPAFAPGSANVLETRYAQVFLASTSVKGSGPTAPTVTLSIEVGFKPDARGIYDAEVAASDDAGNSDDFGAVGTLRVD